MDLGVRRDSPTPAAGWTVESGGGGRNLAVLVGASVLVGTDHGTVLQSSPGGWIERSTGSTLPVTALATDGTAVYAGLNGWVAGTGDNSRGLARSFDGGATWTLGAIAPDPYAISAMAGALLVGGSASPSWLVRSTDRGSGFSDAVGIDAPIFALAQHGRVFAVGDLVNVGRGHPDSYYHVFVSDDGGASFSVVHADLWSDTTGQFKRAASAWAASESELYVAGAAGPDLSGGYLAHSTDGGHSFVQLDFALPLHGVWGDGACVWAVGDGGVVLRACNGGAFARVTVPTTADLYGVAGSTQELWIVGSGGTILHTGH